MSDTDVRAAMDGATRNLQPSPDLLDRVRRGGRRRLVRRRAVLGGGLAAVVAGAAAGGWRLTDRYAGPEIASSLLDEPTRGDLAGDRAYLDEVAAGWRRHVGREMELRGAPHVVWAGSTPAGPVAVVAQRVKPYVYSDVGQIGYGLIGFVEPTDAGPRVVSMESLVEGGERDNAQAVLVGARLDVLVVLDVGVPVEFSPDFRYGGEGRVLRSFAPLRFQDGAAVRRVGAQRDRIRIALRRGTVGPREPVGLANQAVLGSAPGPVRTLVLAGPAGASWPPTAGVWEEWATDVLDPYRDPYGYQSPGPGPHWLVRGGTPDGRQLQVQTVTLEGDPPRVYALLGRAGERPRVVPGGIVPVGEPLVVRLRLPDRQGVLVVPEDDVTLRYRTGRGDWLPVSGGAALLPDAAIEVELRRGSAAPVTAGLPPPS